MANDEKLYEGKTERDLIIGLLGDMRTVKRLLQGNGVAGKKGLCDKVDDIGDTVTTHKVYFALMGGAIIAVIPISVWLLDYLT